MVARPEFCAWALKWGFFKEVYKSLKFCSCWFQISVVNSLVLSQFWIIFNTLMFHKVTINPATVERGGEKGRRGALGKRQKGSV